MLPFQTIGFIEKKLTFLKLCTYLIKTINDYKIVKLKVREWDVVNNFFTFTTYILA
jgi:hypothetical protein